MHVTIKLPQARVNANDKVAVSFESDWSKRWCEFSGPIIEPCKPNPVESRITIDTRLKTVLTGIFFRFRLNGSIMSMSACVQKTKA